MDDTLDLGGWFILRMASLDTLAVFDDLHSAGYPVWTPIERRIGRMPRTRKEYDKRFALMPSYVFARIDALDDLLKFALLPERNCPRFTVFRAQGAIPLIADSELNGLRYQEDTRRARFEKAQASKQKAPKFDEGLEVHLTESGFEGLKGTVIESKGRFTLVDIPGFAQPIKISSLLLQKDVLAGEVNEIGAKAA